MSLKDCLSFFPIGVGTGTGVTEISFNFSNEFYLEKEGIFNDYLILLLNKLSFIEDSISNEDSFNF